MSAEFFNVATVQASLEKLYPHWSPNRQTVTLDPRSALGRVLAEPIDSPERLPYFPRSTMDGYAVRAADTFGATQSLPAYLTCIGSIQMGQTADVVLQSGQCVEIFTGAMLPPHADAVVMIERTQKLGEAEIEILAPVAPGENVVQVGEDIETGELILPAGHHLCPEDIGGLVAVGVLAIKVIEPPRIGILSCGDELVPPDSNPAPGQIRDINAPMLATLVEAAGGHPVMLGIAKDDAADYHARAHAGFAEVDILLMTAGSSVSSRDLTREVIASLGQPGILQHGLAVKPGKPTILAVCDGKPVIGLPGNPVSALLVARQLVVPLIRYGLGQKSPRPMSVHATLTHNIASVTGREDTIPVRLIERDGSWQAEPLFGKSNLIFTLVRADGVVHIPLNSNGIKAGTPVEVMVWDG
ncbi:MAG: molybdopterin molybdenumtransferase MoeA [Chloroflexi bacterium]|nr:molybdopterin molybdenumtransferase MoeA [Chloroflexota bacterium]